MNFKSSLLLPLFFSVSHAFAAPLQQANISKIISDVRVIDKSGAHPAKLQELIKDDRGVMTGIKSRTELLFEDLTLTRLGAETYFSFTPGTRDMLLERGAMLLHVPKGRGGARIRAAGITAAIVGTTIMIEYLPGRSLKVIVLEGSLRLSINRRLGETLLLTAGKMVIMKPDAKQIPDPVDVDLAKLVRTSSLIDPDGFRGPTNVAVAPLPSLLLIEREIAGQQVLKGTRNLVDTNLFILGNGTRVVAVSDPAAVLSPRTATRSLADTADRTQARATRTILETDGGNVWTSTSVPVALSRTARATTDTLLSATSAGSTPVTALASPTLTSIAGPATFTLAETTNLLSGATTATAGLLGTTTNLLDPVLALGGTTNILTASLDSILPVVDTLTPTANLLVSAVPSLLGGKVDLLATASTTLDITTGVSELLAATIDSLGGTGVLGSGNLLANLTGALNLTSGVSFLGGTADLFQSAAYNVGAIDLLSGPLGLLGTITTGDRSVTGTSAPLAGNVAGLFGTTAGLVSSTTSGAPATAAALVDTAAAGSADLLGAAVSSALIGIADPPAGAGASNPLTASVAVPSTDLVTATTTVLTGATTGSPTAILSSASSPVVPIVDTITASPTAIVSSVSSPVVPTLDTITASPTTIVSSVSSPVVPILDTITASPTTIVSNASSPVVPILDTITASPSTILSSASSPVVPIPTASALPTVDASPVSAVPVASVSTPVAATPVTEPVSSVTSIVTAAPTDILSAAQAPLAALASPTPAPAPTQTAPTAAPATFTVSSSNQILSLLSAAPISSGGTIKFESAGADIVVNGQTLKADPGGSVDIRHTGPAGTITLTNATLRGDVVKVGALGTDGRLIIGGGSIDANSTIKLYARGSNGEVRFVDNVSLTGLSTKTIAGSTVTIDNGKTVSIGGLRPANVFTDRPNYSGSGGNGSTSGRFGGAGAATKPFANAPGF